jgi:hypothetical protein
MGNRRFHNNGFSRAEVILAHCRVAKRMPGKRSIERFVVEIPHRQHRRLRSVHLKHRLTSDWSGDPSGMTAGTRTSRRAASWWCPIAPNGSTP